MNYCKARVWDNGDMCSCDEPIADNFEYCPKHADYNLDTIIQRLSIKYNLSEDDILDIVTSYEAAHNR